MLRFAVIGIGRMGSIHAVNLLKGRVKGAKLLCVCDIDKEKLLDFSQKYQISHHMPTIRIWTKRRNLTPL
jgi:predicted dehydrogenase